MAADKPNPAHRVTVVETTQSRPNTTIGELFGELSNQISTLIRGEIELTKVKAVAQAKKSGVAVGLLAAAGVFALYLLGWALHSAEEAFALIMPQWGAAITVTGILLLITVILALAGVMFLKRGMKDKPDPSVNMKLNIAAVKRGMEK
ncbi:MAG: phage holin family protein [Actinomycetaceae bacterium]|nr:phage holin family protein [Actinomycetaceae bacterium]